MVSPHLLYSSWRVSPQDETLRGGVSCCWARRQGLRGAVTRRQQALRAAVSCRRRSLRGAVTCRQQVLRGVKPVSGSQAGKLSWPAAGLAPVFGRDFLFPIRKSNLNISITVENMFFCPCWHWEDPTFCKWYFKWSSKPRRKWLRRRIYGDVVIKHLNMGALLPNPFLHLVHVQMFKCSNRFSPSCMEPLEPMLSQNRTASKKINYFYTLDS